MSSKRFIDDRKHTHPIMFGMESTSDGSIPVKARKNLMQPILRRTPRTLLEVEISNDSTRLLSQSEIFIQSDKHVTDPFVRRKKDLQKIGELEVATRRFPNIVNIGSLQSENILDGVRSEPSSQDIAQNNINVLKDEIYDNLKKYPEFQ